MQKKDNSFVHYARLTLRVLRNLTVMFLKWLLDLLGAKNSAHGNMISSNEDNSQYQIMLSDLANLERRIVKLEELPFQNAESIKELQTQLDSVIDEYYHLFSNLKLSVNQQIADEVSKAVVEYINKHTPQGNVTQSIPQKVYCEPANDGLSLINILNSPDVSANFIELDTSTGVFTIANNPDCVEYILANQDYSLGVCEIHKECYSPRAVSVIEKGNAEKQSNSRDWLVIKKMKIRLY